MAGLFLLGERFIVHSAHQFDTSFEAFNRLLALIENTPEFDSRVQSAPKSHGFEGIILKNGQRIRFRTRTGGGGRGFTGDCLILDEAMILPAPMLGALMPTLSARPNVQIWYTGSAVDQAVHEHGVVFSRIRERGLKGGDPTLAYFEWSTEHDLADITPEVAADPKVWAQANPGFGIRISTEAIEEERVSMDARTFAVERLGAGDWPSTSPLAQRVIDPDLWADCADEDSKPQNPVCFAFDVTPDRSMSCIAVAGNRRDGLPHVEIIEHKRGTRWIGARLEGLVKAWKPSMVVCDGGGPAGGLLPDLESLGIDLTPVSAKEHVQACGVFYDAVEDNRLRHLSTPELNAAVDGAATRTLGEAWAWSRKSSAVDISPLVASTLALWGNAQSPKKSKSRVINLNDL